MAKKKTTTVIEPVEETIIEQTADIVEETVEEVIAPIAYEKRVGKVYKCDKLNVRKEASFSSSIFGTLTHGDEVRIVDETGDFYKIEYNTGIAYVAKEYIR